MSRECDFFHIYSLLSLLSNIQMKYGNANHLRHLLPEEPLRMKTHANSFQMYTNPSLIRNFAMKFCWKFSFISCAKKSFFNTTTCVHLGHANTLPIYLLGHRRFNKIIFVHFEGNELQSGGFFI